MQIKVSKPNGKRRFGVGGEAWQLTGLQNRDREK